MDDFFETAGALMELSGESRQAFRSIAKRLALPRYEMLVRPDSVCNYIYYIEKGLSRTYYFKDGKDITDWITTEKNFACSIVSFITRKPDIRCVELLEDSILWAMRFDDLERLYKTHHEIERFGRLLVSNGLVQVQQRFDDLHFASAHDRYKKLMLINPSIIQRVPLGMVASYLGISQETLSRIRASFH